MTLHLHHLTGCSPSPLAHYLKALGILRIVAEQADSQARGWWQDEHFCLLTTLDREELERFIIEDYSPSAVFNPWGARSGYYSGGNEKTTRLGLTEIENCDHPRLEAFRKCSAEVRSAVADNGGKKPETKEAKSKLIGDLRKHVRNSGAKWLSTVLADLGDESFGPPIFGTGGNEGSGGYTGAYFAAVTECVVRRLEDQSLPAALWDTGSSPSVTWDGSFQATVFRNPLFSKWRI